MTEQYQTIVIVLQDGRHCVFTGRAQIVPDQLANREIRVVDIIVGLPKSLPKGMSFGTILESEHEA